MVNIAYCLGIVRDFFFHPPIGNGYFPIEVMFCLRIFSFFAYCLDIGEGDILILF